jgi:hypothetical protein
VSDEELRLAHFQSEARSRAAALSRSPSPETALCTHDTEVMAAHEGRPTVAEQNVTHDPGLPDVDLGPVPGSVVG